MHDAVIGEILAVGENVDIGVTVGDKVIFRWAMQMLAAALIKFHLRLRWWPSKSVHQWFREGLAVVRGVVAVLPWTILAGCSQMSLGAVLGQQLLSGEPRSNMQSSLSSQQSCAALSTLLTCISVLCSKYSTTDVKVGDGEVHFVDQKSVLAKLS